MGGKNNAKFLFVLPIVFNNLRRKYFFEVKFGFHLRFTGGCHGFNRQQLLLVNFLLSFDKNCSKKHELKI